MNRVNYYAELFDLANFVQVMPGTSYQAGGQDARYCYENGEIDTYSDGDLVVIRDDREVCRVDADGKPLKIY